MTRLFVLVAVYAAALTGFVAGFICSTAWETCE